MTRCSTRFARCTAGLARSTRGAYSSGRFQFAYVTGVLAVAGTALYVDMSTGEALRLLLAGWIWRSRSS